MKPGTYRNTEKMNVLYNRVYEMYATERTLYLNHVLNELIKVFSVRNIIYFIFDVFCHPSIEVFKPSHKRDSGTQCSTWYPTWRQRLICIFRWAYPVFTCRRRGSVYPEGRDSHWSVSRHWLTKRPHQYPVISNADFCITSITLRLSTFHLKRREWYRTEWMTRSTIRDRLWVKHKVTYL